MAIYLIANNRKLSETAKEEIQSIRLAESDEIVRFNHVECRELFKGRTTTLFLRANPQGKYWGVKRDYTLMYPVDVDKVKIVFVGKGITLNEVVQKNGISSYEVLDIYRIKDEYALAGTPSTGFAAIHYFLEKHPDHKLVLIGFTFHLDGRHGWHDFRKEKKHCESLCDQRKISILL